MKNQLSNATRSGTLTVTGATPVPATNVTVNGIAAQRYGDFTFASTNNMLANGANSFQIIATNLYSFAVTNNLTVNLPATVTFQNDANGNLTNDGTRSFYFDAENRLTNVTVAGQYKAVYIYDGLGLRRIRRVYGWQSSAWALTNEIRYIYDGPFVVQERDTNNNILVTYTRGLDMSRSLQGAGGISGLLARTDINGTTYYHCDGNGNITALIDAYGNIVARYEYDAYGRLIGMWGSLAAANVYRFSSKEYDPVTGLYYFGGRYYDPVLQRWLNRDPIRERGGINLYRFTRNNPVSKIDPLGLNLMLDDPESNSDDVDDSPGLSINSTLPINPCDTQGQPGENDLSFETAATVIGGLNIVSDVVQYGSGTASIGDNLMFYTDFYGNQYVSVTRFSEIAETTGPLLAGAGILWDGYGLYNGDVSPTQFTVNTGVAVTAVYIGGPPGAVFGGSYFLMSNIPASTQDSIAEFWAGFQDSLLNSLPP